MNRKKRGVKVYKISEGMKVLKKNLMIETKKGYKMQPKWTGPYKYVLYAP